jgi:flavin reductase (DIM6/NTAB) family NADH-FMN oxidoreductase RutF
VTDIVRLKNHQGEAAEAWMTFGEVVAVHIAKRLLVDGRYQTEAAHPVLRAGGPGDFYELGERFVMARPK